MTDNEPSKLRVMLDANVLVASAFSPRFPYEVVRHASLGDYVLILTEQIIQDAREAIQAHVPNQATAFESLLSATGYQLVNAPSKEILAQNADLMRDPDDIAVALAAITAEVDVLVTSDKDFTDPDEPIHHRLRILLPGAFLREHMGWTSEALEAIRTRTWSELEHDNSD